MTQNEPTLQERINTALSKSEDQRTPEETRMLKAFEAVKERALKALKEN